MSRVKSAGPLVLAVTVAAGGLAGCGMSLPSFTAPVLQEAQQKPAASRIAGYNKSALGHTAQTATPATNGKGMFVEVQPGETILDISRRTKVPVSLIMSENRLPGLQVLPGQRLFIPKL